MARPDPPTDPTDAGLLAVGLRAGDRVRYRRREGGTWREARVERRERDGAVGVRDAQGAARTLPLDRLEVRRTGPRGGAVWLPVAELAAQEEQLGLW